MELLAGEREGSVWVWKTGARRVAKRLAPCCEMQWHVRVVDTLRLDGLVVAGISVSCAMDSGRRPMQR